MIIIIVLLVEVMLLIKSLLSFRNRYILREGAIRFLFPLVWIAILFDKTESLTAKIFISIFVLVFELFIWAFIGIKYYFKPVSMGEAFTIFEDILSESDSDGNVEIVRYERKFYDFGVRQKVKISRCSDKLIMVSLYRVVNYRRYKRNNLLIFNKLEKLRLAKCSSVVLDSFMLIVWTVLTIYFMMNYGF